MSILLEIGFRVFCWNMGIKGMSMTGVGNAVLKPQILHVIAILDGVDLMMIFQL